MKINWFAARNYLWKEWVRPLAVVAAIVLPLKSAVADWNWVPTGSMRPTILEGELVFINKLAYDFKVPFTTVHLAEWANPQRGEIVVFFSPKDGTRLVKRVIGLPGDKIALRTNRLIINGEPVSYETTSDDWRAYATPFEKENAHVFAETLGTVKHPEMTDSQRMALRDFQEITVPAGHYFMMGDNRDNSYDSRYFGFVERQRIVGQAKATVFSFDQTQHLLPRLQRFFTVLL
jgi:signal peptidase I